MMEDQDSSVKDKPPHISRWRAKRGLKHWEAQGFHEQVASGRSSTCWSRWLVFKVKIFKKKLVLK